MELSFYYISRWQNTQTKVTHLNISHKAVNQSMQLKNTWSLSKKLTEFEKTLLKHENNPFNIGKWDFHATVFQSTPYPLPGATNLD